MNTLIFALWGAVILLKAVAIAMLAWRRLAWRYPFLVLFLGAGFVRSVYLVYQYRVMGNEGYRDGLTLTQPIVLLTYAFVTGEAFFQFVRHLPRAWGFSVGLFVFLVIGAAGLIAAGSSIGLTPWPRAAVEGVSRNFSAGCLFVLLAGHCFWAAVGFPAGHLNARRNAEILELVLLGEVLGRGIVIFSEGSYWPSALAQVLIMSTAIAALWLWSFGFPGNGEAFSPVLPDPDADQAAEDILEGRRTRRPGERRVWM